MPAIALLNRVCIHMLAVAVLICSNVSPSWSADFVVINDRSGDFSGGVVSLRGKIKKGDLDRLKAAVRKVGEYHPDSPRALHLDSPGGSFKEALKLVEYLLSNPFTTVINQGAQCYSACAMIFMTGHYSYRYASIDRRMHVSAKLGFHAPYVPEHVQVGYNLAIRQLNELLLQMETIAYADKPVQVMRQSLMTALLRKRANEFLEINTIDTVGRWHIDIFGHRPPQRVTKDSLMTACSNKIAWDRDEEAGEPRELDTVFMRRTRDRSTVNIRFKLQGTAASGNLEDAGCDVSFDTSQNLSIDVWRGHPPSEFQAAEEARTWILYPGNTPLKNIGQ